MRRFTDGLPIGDQLGICGAKTMCVLHEFRMIRLERRGESHRRYISCSTTQCDHAPSIPSLEAGHHRYRAPIQQPGEASGRHGADVSVPSPADGS